MLGGAEATFARVCSRNYKAVYYSEMDKKMETSNLKEEES